MALVHGSFIHLMFNMYALWIIGPIVEALYGPWRYLGIYALCAIAGSAASYATSPTPAVGASGAVFGLFGALLVADRVHKPALTRNARNLTTQIGILIGINLFIGFSMRGIDNAAHIGGLLAGAWLGFVLVPRGARLDSFWSRPRGADGSAPNSDSGQRGLRLRQVGGVAALVAVIVLALAIGPVTWQPSDYIIGSAQPGPGHGNGRRCGRRHAGPGEGARCGCRPHRGAVSARGNATTTARRAGASSWPSRSSRLNQVATLPASARRSSGGSRCSTSRRLKA